MWFIDFEYLPGEDTLPTKTGQGFIYCHSQPSLPRVIPKAGAAEEGIASFVADTSWPASAGAIRCGTQYYA